ncbi:thiol-disulfide isomerase [Pseudomonas cremoricolorata]|uniref:Thiol-disulfide isomerase n=2 Tax=Pseudomonas cremoricolorata TaxID=157783 RepID=A0A089WJA4_9PSED|nr:thiol-disulfide isomerase [Pseudomonas cremoricolorata]
MSSPSRSTLMLVLLVLFGAAVAWFAYERFQARYLRPFDHQATLFDGRQLQLPAEIAGPGAIRVVHFWDPSCPCNVGNQQHLSELVQRFAGPEVQFHTVRKPGSHGQLPQPLADLPELPALPGSAQLPASPAVAIWDRQGTLVYFGPWSEGAVCNASNSFVEPIIQALRAGRTVTATNTLAVGCYCPWSAAEEPR